MDNQQLNNQPQYLDDEDEISLLDILQVIAENLRTLIFLPLFVGLLALAGSYLIPPEYTAKTVIVPPQQNASAASAVLGSLGALSGLAASSGLKNPLDIYVAFLKSRSVGDNIIKRFDLINKFAAKNSEEAFKKLMAQSTIASSKEGVINIEFTDTDANLAAKIANVYPEELQKVMSRLAVTEAQLRRKFFEDQLNLTKEKLITAEQVLKSTGVNASVLKSNPEIAVGDLAKIKAAITAQEFKIASMRGYLAETAPEMRQNQQSLSMLKNQLSKIERDDPVTSQNQSSDYIARYREYKYQETLLEIFAKQFEIAKVDEAREGTLVQVLDVAQVPQQKTKPKKAQIALIATFASFFLLILFIFMKTAMKNASSDRETAAKVSNIKNSLRRFFGFKLKTDNY